MREPGFLTVCSRGDGRRAEDLCAELTGRGLAMVGHAVVDGEAVVRLALVNAQTDEAELERLFEELRMIAKDVRATLVA